MRFSKSLVSIVALGVAAASSAVNLNLTTFSTAHQASNTFNGFTRDRSTGDYYKSAHYSGNTLNRYTNLGDFQADTNSTMATLGDQRFGTYHVVRNQKFFARSTTQIGTTVSRFNALTGAVELTANFANIDGTNGPATFDWGGFSTFNLFDDPSGLFMFARDLSGDQLLMKVDSNLNLLNTFVISQAPTDPLPGYAFVVNGQMFVGDDFWIPTFTRRIDLTTGFETAVNFTFTGISGFPYLNHMFYDNLADRLYVTSSYSGVNSDDRTYYMDNVAAQLDVVPEPGSMLVLGLGALALMRRRK